MITVQDGIDRVRRVYDNHTQFNYAQVDKSRDRRRNQRQDQATQVDGRSLFVLTTLLRREHMSKKVSETRARATLASYSTRELFDELIARGFALKDVCVHCK